VLAHTSRQLRSWLTWDVGQRKMRLARSLLAAVLALIVTPIFMSHGCGLSSWPIEWAVGLCITIGAFVLTFSIQKKWLAWTTAIVAPVAAFLITNAYFTWLHSDAFPDRFLDRSGHVWKDRHQK